MASRIADEYKISTTTLYNLIQSESSWKSDVIADMEIKCPVGPNKGLPVRARGLAQITQCYHPEVTDEQAFDPEFAITYLAKEIKKDNQWKEHASCNCYTYMKMMVHHLPAMKDIVPNTEVPVIGGIVILKYWNSTVEHLAYIKSITADGLNVVEANFEACKITKRIIALNDPHLVGYYRNSSPDN